MIRYIDAEKLKTNIKSHFDMQDLYLPVHFLDEIEKLPTENVISIADMALLLRDFTGEHAPCIFGDIGNTFGHDCNRKCYITHDCWERFILWWTDQKKKE